ncbi:uncharacterized protein LOC107044181 [Diachasma alloeum]|uniref:uncharacterized protein LOC107044181 n=1 Tax=Diachasma alloeum TaxID=454923 RepID=UPI0007383F5E|nr:uncharacterized protein LOC107044181 [Diachasma alloeum]
MPPKLDEAGLLIIPPVQVTQVVDVKTTRFCEEKPALWFAHLESQFRNKGIVTEIDKFHFAVPLIDTRSAARMEDLIINPPMDTPYRKLKNKLIERFTQSKQANLLQLLDGEKLGDRKPSEHFRHLKCLVPDIDEDVLKARWVSHLPQMTQACFVTQKTATIEELAETADRLHEVLQPARVASVSNLEQQIAELMKQVASLATHVSRRDTKPDPKRSRSRSRSIHKLNKSTGICWYHNKYGNKARNCVPGCKSAGNLNESH